jgi:hypothetical protein
MKVRSLLLLLFCLPLLAACDIEPAAYLIDGGDHSLTVERRKPYFWSEGWELDLVVARFPECQRRHPLKKSGEKVRVDLYKTDTGAFIINQNKRWYVAETRECKMQQFEQEPAEPGSFLGSFRVKNGVFGFVTDEPEEKNGKAARK